VSSNPAITLNIIIIAATPMAIPEMENIAIIEMNLWLRFPNRKYLHMIHSNGALKFFIFLAFYPC